MRWKPTKARVAAIAIAVAVYAALAASAPWLFGGDARAAYAAAGAALMAILWITDAVPIAVPACIPILLFPVTGVFGGDVAHGLRASVEPYAHPYIFLFMGGMGIAASMQQWDLHRRIALSIMRVVGSEPKRLLFGFLCATAFISLWISNTATAAMMLPIGIALCRQIESQRAVRIERYGAAIMLSIAYASNVGGIGTRIGTATNAIFAQFMEGLGRPISFLEFSAVGLPFVVLFLPVVWWVLWRVGRADAEAIGDIGRSAIDGELRKLGSMKRAEAIVLSAFVFAAAVWMAGQPIAALIGEPVKSAHIEGGVAVIVCFVLVLSRCDGRRVLELGSLRAQPWSTLLLLGGSFTMANAIQESGLSRQIGGGLSSLSVLSPFAQVLAASIVTVLLSAIATNTATASVLLGVLAGAVAPGLMPAVLFSVTISASCDFALPAGTPPNAIVFASGYLTVRRMAASGAVLDLAAAILSAILCHLLVPLLGAGM
jgi:sodium-dependent dicarboxylate transporter 2/3/5